MESSKVIEKMPYDESKFKIWTWKHPYMLHWLLNPAMAIVELFLGQRVPKVMLVEKDPSKSLLSKTMVPCPHCHTLHKGTKWTQQNKTVFKNWFGLFCDNCGQTIPCLTNLTSYLLLALTFPFWFWSAKNLRAHWLKKQPERYKNLDLETIPNPFGGTGWIKSGLTWGAFMYAFMTFLFPFMVGDEIKLDLVLLSIPIWVLGGLGYGYTMKLVMDRKQAKA